jgi:hypothetical protein
MVFSITQNGHTALFSILSDFGKNLQIQIETDLYMQPKILPCIQTSVETRPKCQRLL